MAKSEGNFLTLENAFLKHGFSPLAYRFGAFLTHYRKPMEYSDEGIAAARNGLLHLQNQVRQIATVAAHESDVAVNMEFKNKFLQAINDDLNMPRAMAVVQEMLKSTIADSEKYATVVDYDRILGFNLDQLDKAQALPEGVQELVEARKKAREAKDFSTSDRLREELEALGYMVQDAKDGMKIIKK
jgi:cysteinyl-tRNA synthetase